MSLAKYIKDTLERKFWEFAQNMSAYIDIGRWSSHPSVTWEFMQSHPDVPWNKHYRSENPNVTWDTVQANPTKFWDYQHLSRNPNITLDIVRENPRENWLYDSLSCNPNITLDIVQANPNIKWSYFMLSANPNIKWETTQAYPNEEWSSFAFSTNPNLTWDIVLDNLDEPWCIYDLYANPSLKECPSHKNSTEPIYQKWLYYNSIATGQVDLKSANLAPDEYGYLSCIPNITWNVILNNLDKPWNFNYLARNNYPYQNMLIKEQCIREWFAVKLIKKNYVRTFWDPESYFGRKRLQRSWTQENYEVWAQI